MQNLMIKADYFFKIPESGQFKILQVTDTQIIDASQKRYEGRLSAEETKKWQPENFDRLMTKYLDEAVHKTNPDLIIHTGDFTYGEFDDSGAMLAKHIGIMDGYGVPWSLALGNHERETKLGEKEYCKRIASAKNSIFLHHTEFSEKKLEGSANYSILLTDKNDKPVILMFILDTGCFNEEIPGGIYDVQRAWMQALSTRYGVKSLVFMHVPLKAYNDVVSDLNVTPFTPREITRNDGFGYLGEYFPDRCCIDADGSLMKLFKDIGVIGVFAGHVHKNSYSVLLNGIRLTYGLKTSEYDSHIKEKLGGTLIKAYNNGDFSVEHIYTGRKNQCK